MQQRWVRIVTGVVRFVLVVVAFGLAVGSIGLSAARGFCPQGTELGALVAATLADVAPDDATPTAPDTPATPTAPPSPPDAPTDAPGDAPAETPAQEPTGAPAEGGGACAGGVQRCLPPLVSSVVIFGDGRCHDEAGGRLRGILVPAFVGSTVLLAAAWYLQPERLRRAREAVVSGG